MTQRGEKMKVNDRVVRRLYVILGVFLIFSPFLAVLVLSGIYVRWFIPFLLVGIPLVVLAVLLLGLKFLDKAGREL
jgi:hypothetical protein